MKQVFLTIAVLIFFFSSVSAQINVTIFVQKPTPTSISSWQTLPNVVQVIITNSTPNPYSNCIISIKIKNQNGTVIAKTKDYDPGMPKFNIPGAPGTLMLNAPQLFKYDAIWVDPNIQSVVTTTNSLPEGDYQLCMSIIDPYGNQLVNGIEKCSDFNITLSDPPQLIMPLDKDLLTTNYPHFFWTPGTISPYFIDVHYRLKIVKLFAQQSAKDAITTNSALFDKQIVGTSYQYLPSDFNIGNYTDSYGFAWQVQVYNNNQPVTGMGHDGKSEIWTFLPPAANPTTLKLVSPLDNSTISPASAVYKLVWDASKQKKSITSFTLKVVEVEQGQTPDIAMKVNQPVYYKENIPPGFYNYLIAEDQNVFYDQLKYAWQVFTCSTAYGGIIDSSVIWSFTVKSNFIESLTAVSPADNAVFPPDTGQYSGYSFIWNRDKVVKSISEYRLLIAPVDSGQTAAQAIKLNVPTVDKVVSEPIKSWKIMQEQGIFENKKYAWIVIASSKWYNNQIVAKTEPRMFTITGAVPLANNVTSFYFGKYKIKVNTISNKNAANFSGTGETNLWNNGPLVSFSFHSLSIAQIDTLGAKYWKVKSGEIWESVTPADIPLTIGVGANSSLSAKLKIDVFRINNSFSNVHAVIKLATPFLRIESAVTTALTFETYGSWMNIDPLNKVYADSVILAKVLPEYKLVQPLNFYLYVSDFTSFTIKNNKVDIHLSGAVTLPDKFKNNDGTKIIFKFKNMPGFKFDLDNTGEATYYKLTTNNDLLCHVEKVNIDLYAGIVSVTQGGLNFDYHKFGLSPISIGTNDGVNFSSNGFQANVVKSKMTTNVSYRGYQFVLTDLRLCIFKDAYFGQNYLKGDVIVPFINQKAGLKLNFGSNGIIGGDVSANFVQNWVTLQTANGGDVKLQLKIVAITYTPYANQFMFNGYFQFINPNGKGLGTDSFAVSNVQIDSLGKLSIYGSDQYGWQVLNVAKTGKFNGFPITVTKFKINQYQYSYYFALNGTIVLSDNLSNTGGSEFNAGIEMPQDSYHGGLPPANDSIKTEPTKVAFGNDQSDFACSVTFFHNDPLYGNGFLAQTKIMLHSPGDFEADSKIIIGKTDNGNGFSYWFLEAGVELPFAVQTGILDIGIRSFHGRIYSHMKHQGTDINNSDYIPDQGNTFGIYGNLGIETSENDGVTLWGKVGFEVIIGPGFTSTLTGHVNILSSGWGVEDGMVQGDAVITVSTSPKLFDANFEVTVNLKGGLCAHGTMQMHIDEQTWFLHVGTPDNQVTASLLCSSSGYYGYFDIDKSSTSFGLGYTFDTGDQQWGEVVGCWGRAWGSIGATATLNYNPFQFTGTASLSGSANIGVFVDLEVWSGKLTLLSGTVSASLTLEFPSPVCVAGRLHAEGCIDPCPVFSCDICFGATLKVRYKNGSFALSDNCD